MYDLLKELFPITRSITGNGVRQTLNILNQHAAIKLYEVPSGTKVFDWIVPDEWNIKDAYVKNKKGDRVIDFKISNLHVVGYSEPFQGFLNLQELKSHLHTLPDQPNLIPYVTSYYNKYWGFCLAHNDLLKLKDEIYEVKIDSTFTKGSLTYGELVIKGKSDREVLLSTYICHPSMANNELSGPVVTTFLSKYLQNISDNLLYTYRILFVPETIGSITYLSLHYKHMMEKTIAGYVITTVGDSGPFSYLKSRTEDTLVDRVTLHALKYEKKDYKIYDYLHRGSDERQYCSPNIDLPVGSLMRSKYNEYPEYHTSGDDLNIVSSIDLEESLEMYKTCIYYIENNKTYKLTTFCEPNLGKRGLYPLISDKKSHKSTRTLVNFLAYCDGENDLLWIAEKINCSMSDLVPIANNLLDQKLISQVDKL